MIEGTQVTESNFEKYAGPNSHEEIPSKILSFCLEAKVPIYVGDTIEELFERGEQYAPEKFKNWLKDCGCNKGEFVGYGLPIWSKNSKERPVKYSMYYFKYAAKGIFKRIPCRMINFCYQNHIPVYVGETIKTMAERAKTVIPEEYKKWLKQAEITEKELFAYEKPIWARGYTE